MRFESARRAWEAVYRRATPQGLVSVPGSTAYDSSDAAWNAVEIGKVQAAIATLNPLHRSWGMRFCTAEFTEKDEWTLREFAWDRFKKTYGSELNSHRHTVRLCKLLVIAIDDAAIREMSGRPKFTSAEVARQIEVKPQNWNRDWEQPFLTMLDALLDLTPATLGPIARVVEEMRGRCE